ncbi:MAG: class I SAM-dependent methyltransferase [Gemmatimonadaceae bacterium]|nr:class I SAM-dependent methyltransferase [Gemmatimonadaceae bacterium]
MTRSAVQREYGALAAGYDARWSGYVRATTDMALARVPCAPNVRLLDVGCGTGALLDRALTMQPAMQCTGVDLTREMLQRAAMRLGGRASLVQGSGDALPVADACVDVVVSTSALHYMRDAVRVLREMRRVLVPGGTLVLTDWCADYRAMRWLDRLLRVGDPAHVRTLRCSELGALVASAGFSRVRVESAKAGRFWGLMTVVGVA